MDSFTAELGRNGFDCVRVSWEDTARAKGSCYGPNISDVTLRSPDGALHSVVRRPNFEDRSSDIPFGKIRVNKDGEITTLHALLDQMGLLKTGETVGLMQVQSCIVPKPSSGAPEFCPALYNYQSHNGDPAVLVLVITSMGVTIHAPGSKTELLLMNNSGTLAWYHAEALGDIRGTGPVQAAQMSVEEQRGNYLFIVQVPLQRKREERPVFLTDWCTFGGESDVPTSYSACVVCPRGTTDMARVTAGASAGRAYATPTGPHVRDTRFPVRITVCSYRVVTGKPNEHDAVDIVEQLKNLEKMGMNHGSLVVSPVVNTARSTEPDLSSPRASDDPFAKTTISRPLCSFRRSRGMSYKGAVLGAFLVLFLCEFAIQAFPYVCDSYHQLVLHYLIAWFVRSIPGSSYVVDPDEMDFVAAMCDYGASVLRIFWMVVAGVTVVAMIARVRRPAPAKRSE